MQIDLSKLNMENIIRINDVINIPNEYFASNDIRGIDNLKVEGTINSNMSVNLDVKGQMIVPDARDLSDVYYPFAFTIEEIIEENAQYLKNNGKTLDLTEFLWENVVLEKPIRIVKDENEFLKQKGEGWEMSNGQKLDERLAPLRELLDKEGE